MKTNIETRYTDGNVEVNDRHVSGYAVVFDTDSVDLGGFTETIHRGAITDETINGSDILCRLNHSDSKVYARSKYGNGSLKLTVDNIGVRYEFDAPNTDAGNELLEYLKRGDITASSFAFSIDPEDGTAEKWFDRGNGDYHREIYKISALYDVSPVFHPAYPATSCEATAKRFADVKATADEIFKLNDIYLQDIENL